MKTWVRLHGTGNAGWLTLTVAVVVALQTTAALAQNAKLPAAEDIIEKSIEAMGGREAMEKTHNRVSKATVEMAGQGVTGTLTTYEAAPNRQYFKAELKGAGPTEGGSDGKVLWESNVMMGPRVREGVEKAVYARLATFNGALHWKKLYQKADCAGVEDVEDYPCYKVVFTPEEGEPETVFYDRKSYLPRKRLQSIPSPMGPIPVEELPTDYRRVDGVLIPFKVTQTIAGVQQMIVTVESVEHNADIPAERFALPEAVQALVGKSGAKEEETGGAKPREP